MRKRLTVAAAALAALALFLFSPWLDAHSRQPSRIVEVSNLPEVVQIEGKVSVVGTIDHGDFSRRLSLIVPPVGRHEVNDLVVAEALETEGFSHVGLSLQGEVRGTVLRAGAVGAVLVPDEEPVLKAMREYGALQFPLEVTTTLAQGHDAVFSAQQHLALGFPRYRIYLYNSTDRTLDVNLYLYLTH